MGDGKWLSRGIRRKQGGKQRGAASRHRATTVSDRGALGFETLEDRRVLAFVVTALGDLDADDNVIFGSLRWAVNAANATDEFDEIVFSDGLFGDGAGTIALNGGALEITQPIAIVGPGARKLTVAQTGADQRVFDLNVRADDEILPVQISGLTVSGGNIVGTDEQGGGIYNREDLTLIEVIVDDNSAPIGGGVYNAIGRITISRSLFINNTAGIGGGIANGDFEEADGDEPGPTLQVDNSTFSGNSAGLWGGAVFNGKGTVTIRSSTISENLAGDEGNGGYGVASYGNPNPDEEGGEPPPPVVFTNIGHSIIYGNNEPDPADPDGDPIGSDVQRVGVDDEGNELQPSVTTLGWNFVGTGNTTDETSPDFTFGAPPPDPPGGDPLPDYVGIDPELDVLDDYGGSTDVYLLLPTSPAIDAGNPDYFVSEFEQRGRHFVREYNYNGLDEAIIDVGAVEMQSGVFLVDTLLDVDNLIYSKIFTITLLPGLPADIVVFPTYETEGNFSIREAINFARKNPGLDTILFSDNLNSTQILLTEDLTDSKAPTILLRFGALTIDEDLIIQGPEGFVLEIDASGNDPTPQSNNGDGSRVFNVDDSNPLNQSVVSISNLTVMGGDVVDGGGIFSREDLALAHMTFKENNSTDDGGGLYVARGTVTVEGSTFNNNRAASDGGGIYVETLVGASQSSVTLVNSTLSANVASNRGAGLYNNNSKLDVRFSTFTLNNAGSTIGSGIHNAGADALTSVWATVASNNVNSDVNFSGSAVNTFESLGDNYIGKGNGNAVFVQPGDRRNANTPMLAPLFNTGGLVETHRPLSGSPLIDTGPVIVPGSDPPAPEFDQRGPGFNRIFDGNQDGVLRADVGAYELQGLVLKVDSGIDENDGDFTSGNFSLREAVQLANDNPLPDVIEFDPTLFATLNAQDPSISLGGVLAPGTPMAIRITDDLTINGPGQGALAIDGSGMDDPSSLVGSRMFVVDDGIANSKINVTVSGLEFRNALASQGGAAFYSRENLTFIDTAFVNNSTYADPTNLYTGLHGGAVFQETGKLTINGSLFTTNSTMDVGADGGAIYVVDGVLELNDTTLAGNATEQSNSDGGALYVKNSTVTAFATVFSGNVTSGGVADGGGFFSEGSTVTLNEVVISGNSTIGSNSEGAGFAALDSAITLNDTVVSLNQSVGNQSSGVGAYTTGGTMTANRSLFRENSSTGLSSFGAGLATSGGTVYLNETSVTANSTAGSGSHGGGVANLGGVVVIRNSTIADNHANHSQSKGGGVYSDTNLLGTQSTLILNSTISTNTAPLRGGGVFNADGLTEIKHSTITNNTSGFLNVGSGVASQGNAATQTKVLSSIIAGNVGSAAGTGSDVDSVDANFSNSFVSLGYNVIGKGNSLAAFNQIGDQSGIANPLLGPLEFNGQAPNLLFELQTHALLAGSPAINAGSPAFNPNAFTPAMTTDQRGEGFARVKNGRIDAGAFESDLAPALPADFNGNGRVDGADFLTWQRNFGKTGGIKADGDANGDGNVNGVDLAAWKAGFGSVAASAAASSSASASSSAALMAEEEVAAASAPTTEPIETSTAPAVAATSSAASRGRFDSLASLGRASVAPKAAAAPVLDEAILWNAPAAPTKRIVSVFLDDEKSADLDLLLADEAGSEAEDAVFAAWGEEFL